MKILIVSQYYNPTRIAATVRVERMVKILSKSDQVTVLTGFPTLNETKLKKIYRGKFYQKSHDGNATVYRTYNFSSQSQKFLVRVWNQFTFMVSSFLVGLIIPKPDLIIATSPPLFVGLAASFLSIFRKVPMIFDVRDLWPESVVVLGILKNRLAIWLAVTAENFIYRTSKAITVVTLPIEKHLKERYRQKPIYLLTNATDTAFFKPIKIRKSLFGYQEKDIVVTYLGILSQVQALDKVLLAAKSLLQEQKIKFLFVGKGDDEKRLFGLGKNLSNVKFLPHQPKEKVLEIINMSDICLVTLKGDPLFAGAIPTKVFEYLACQKAVVAAARGEIEKVLLNGKTGVVVSPEKPNLLAKAILKLAKDKKLRTRLGANGRRLVEEKFSQKLFTKKLKAIIKNRTWEFSR